MMKRSVMMLLAVVSVGAGLACLRGKRIAATGQVGTAISAASKASGSTSFRRTSVGTGAVPRAALVQSPPQKTAGGDADSSVVNVDVTKVRAALERFRSVARGISQEKLNEERERMKTKLEELSKTSVEEPTSADFVDNDGRRWVKLTYPSGEVRYDFPDG